MVTFKWIKQNREEEGECLPQRHIPSPQRRQTRKEVSSVSLLLCRKQSRLSLSLPFAFLVNVGSRVSRVLKSLSRWILGSSLLLAACERQSGQDVLEKNQIWVTIPPLYSAVSYLLDNTPYEDQVSLLSMQDANIHEAVLTPLEWKALQEADLVLSFDSQSLETFLSNKDQIPHLVDLHTEIKKETQKGCGIFEQNGLTKPQICFAHEATLHQDHDEHHDEDHDEHHEGHSHDEFSHLFFDPAFMADLGKWLFIVLGDNPYTKKVLPFYLPVLKRNVQTYEKRWQKMLDELNQDITKAHKQKDGKPSLLSQRAFYSSHDAFEKYSEYFGFQLKGSLFPANQGQYVVTLQEMQKMAKTLEKNQVVCYLEELGHSHEGLFDTFEKIAKKRGDGGKIQILRVDPLGLQKSVDKEMYFDAFQEFTQTLLDCLMDA